MQSPLQTRQPELLETVCTVLVKSLREQGDMVDEVDPDSDLLADGTLDSLATISFLLDLEVALGIEISFESLELDDLRTVAALCRFLMRQPEE